MSPIVKLRMTFDSPQTTFPSGTAVTGHVHVDVEEKDGAKIRGVKVEWKGQSKTNFRFRGHWYSKSESHIDNEMYIMGSSDRSKPCIMLQEGSHALPFSVFLPPNIPGTFNQDNGSVSYEIYAKINFPYNLFDPHTTREFTVTKNNVLSGTVLSPFLAPKEDRIHFICCVNKGEITTTIGMPRSGYLPREELQFSLKVENESSKEIQGSSVKLIQITHFEGRRRATHNKKTNAPLKKDQKVTRTIDSLDFPGVNPQDTYERMDNVLRLDYNLIPSNCLECCSIMQSFYELQVTVFFGCPYPNKVRTIPIQIGTAYNYGPPAQHVDQGPNMFMQAANPPLAPSYPPGGFPSQIPYPPQGYAPVLQYPEPPGVPYVPNAPIEPYSPPPPYNPNPPDDVKY